MTSPTCQKCDCIKGCQSNPVPCPNLLAKCIASGQVSAAEIEQHRLLDEAIAQPVQPASTDKHWCETCDGSGTIDETLCGEYFSNQKAECPDCDGNGIKGQSSVLFEDNYAEGWVKCEAAFLAIAQPKDKP